MRHLTGIALTVAAMSSVALSTAAQARPGYSTSMSRPTYYSMTAQERSLMNDWSYRQGADRGQNSYAAALQFARCAVRFDAAAADRLLSSPVGQPGDRQALIRLVDKYRACTGEISAVAPVLLRAALAETTLMSSPANPKMGSRKWIGVPDVVQGFPLVAVARCQLIHAPAKVSKLFSTSPGAASERAAAADLYSGTPACGTSSLGGIQPTVARLALIEAAYHPE